MKIVKISKDTVIPTVWNGGETFEYYIYPEDSSYVNRDFLFRISAATINKVPSTFTKFKNYQRFLVMFDNDLQINRNGVDETYAQYDIFKFDSNTDITSYSKGNDFNLMVSKNVKNADIFFLKDEISIKRSFVFLFALSDVSIDVNDDKIDLKKTDLILIENDSNSDVLLKTEHSILVGSLMF